MNSLLCDVDRRIPTPVELGHIYTVCLCECPARTKMDNYFHAKAVHRLSNSLVRLPAVLGGRSWGEADFVGLTVLLQKQTLMELCECIQVVENVKLFVVHQMLAEQETPYTCEMLLHDVKGCIVLQGVMESGYLPKDWGSLAWLMQFESQTLVLDSLE